MSKTCTKFIMSIFLAQSLLVCAMDQKNSPTSKTEAERKELAAKQTAYVRYCCPSSECGVRDGAGNPRNLCGASRSRVR